MTAGWLYQFLKGWFTQKWKFFHNLCQRERKRACHRVSIPSLQSHNHNKYTHSLSPSHCLCNAGRKKEDFPHIAIWESYWRTEYVVFWMLVQHHVLKWIVHQKMKIVLSINVFPNLHDFLFLWHTMSQNMSIFCPYCKRQWVQWDVAFGSHWFLLYGLKYMDAFILNTHYFVFHSFVFLKLF